MSDTATKPPSATSTNWVLLAVLIAVLLCIVLIGAVALGAFVASSNRPNHLVGPGVVAPLQAGHAGFDSTASASTKSIATEATAVRRIAPDLASIVLMVKTVEPTPAEAQLRNEATQRAVVAAVRAAGVPADSINPFGLDISEQERTENETRIIEYIVLTEVHVDTKDLPRLAEVLQGAFKAGASTGRVEFKTTKLRELRDKARRDAVKAA
jgi:uncharacterized protein YggE